MDAGTTAAVRDGAKVASLTSADNPSLSTIVEEIKFEVVLTNT